MKRRAFLTALAAGLIGAAVDVDKLLWVPGAKTIFLPPAPAGRYVDNLMVALRREALLLTNLLHPIYDGESIYSRQAIAAAAKDLADRIDVECFNHVYGISTGLPPAWVRG